MPKIYKDARLRRVYFSLPNFMREGFASVYSMTRYRRRFGGVFRSHLYELQENADWTAEEYAANQLQRLRSTLSYAGLHCPYYRELFKEVGLKPGEINSLSDLQHVPLLDRETVRRQGERLVALPPVHRTIRGETGGTTGFSLKFIVTEETNQRHYATQWFHMSWAGIKRGDRVAHVSGHPVGRSDSLGPPFWVIDRFEKMIIFSPQHMTPDNLPAYARALADYQPAVITGAPSSIHLMAVHLLETGRDDIRPKAVFTWAETTLSYQRQSIEQAFGCRVYSSYGNSERTGYLLQCKVGNFHVVPETCVIEVLDSLGNPVAPGEMGELVCTSLMERAMPLIRYRVGDSAIGAKGLCSCGRTTPIVRAIGGRTNSFIIGRDGRRYGPLVFFFSSAMQIKEGQFVQNDPSSVCIRVVPGTGFGPANKTLIMEAANKIFANQIDVTIEVVDAIPRTKSGKFPFVITHLDRESVEHSKGLVA